jgi:hypothetical protein
MDALFNGARRYSDRNDDGELTLSELLGTSLISLPSPVYNLYSKLDRNKDERLSREEALDFLWRTFVLIDSNSDCFITEDEVVALLRQVGVPGDIQLAVRLILKQYLTLGSYLVLQFAEKARTGSLRVTVEDVIDFNDFDFIEEMIPAVLQLGAPSGAVFYLTGGGRRDRSRERDQDFLEVWLTVLQDLLEQSVYSDPSVIPQCPGTEE